MKTIENNKLIAEFMAGRKVDIHHNMYHISWNELMPVIEKIESIKGNNNKYFVVEIALCFCRIYSKPKAENFHINKGFDTKLTSTYNAVVEFINWYNKNK